MKQILFVLIRASSYRPMTEVPRCWLDLRYSGSRRMVKIAQFRFYGSASIRYFRHDSLWHFRTFDWHLDRERWNTDCGDGCETSDPAQC